MCALFYMRPKSPKIIFMLNNMFYFVICYAPQGNTKSNVVQCSELILLYVHCTLYCKWKCTLYMATKPDSIRICDTHKISSNVMQHFSVAFCSFYILSSTEFRYFWFNDIRLLFGMSWVKPENVKQNNRFFSIATHR